MTKSTAIGAFAAVTAMALFGQSALAQSTNRADVDFLKVFARASAAEIDEGKIAAEKARNTQVKSFAEQIVDDHSNALDKVTELADKRRIDISRQEDPVETGRELLLEHRDESRFDADYIRDQIRDHEGILKILDREIDQGQDLGVKQLATQLKPIMQRRLDMAEQLRDRVAAE